MNVQDLCGWNFIYDAVLSEAEKLDIIFNVLFINACFHELGEKGVMRSTYGLVLQMKLNSHDS